MCMSQSTPYTCYLRGTNSLKSKCSMRELQKDTVKKLLFLENCLFGVTTSNTADYYNWKEEKILGLGMVTLCTCSCSFLVERTTWVRAWSCTSWSFWLSSPQLQHYMMIVWTNNIQLVYTSYIVVKKGRTYSWMQKITQEKHQLAGIMSGCTIGKYFEFVSKTKCTGGQRPFKKCHLMWKSFREKEQKSHW